jgi:hypothetical protein
MTKADARTVAKLLRKERVIVPLELPPGPACSCALQRRAICRCGSHASDETRLDNRSLSAILG